MFSRGIRRGSHELKVVADVLFNAFGLSLTKRWKTSGFFGIPSHRITLEVECIRRRIGGVGFSGSGKLSFEPELGEHPVTAATRVWRSVGVADHSMFGPLWVDAYTTQPVWFGVSPTHRGGPLGTPPRFLRRLRRRCPHWWVTRLSPRTGVPGSLTQRSAGAGFQGPRPPNLWATQLSRAIQGYLKDRARVLYNNINPRKTLFMPLVDFLLGAIRCVVHRVEVIGMNPYPDRIRALPRIR